MSLKILLADDSMTAQNMGKKILTDAGHEVVAVSNGAAALKKIAESRPDLIIVDIYMPGYTGLEVCQKSKSAPATANVPVILTVGKLEPYRPEDGAKVNADGIIIKPFEATELIGTVARIAERLAAAPASEKIMLGAPASRPVEAPASQPAEPVAPALAVAAVVGVAAEPPAAPSFEVAAPDAASVPAFALDEPVAAPGNSIVIETPAPSSGSSFEIAAAAPVFDSFAPAMSESASDIPLDYLDAPAVGLWTAPAVEDARIHLDDAKPAVEEQPAVEQPAVAAEEAPAQLDEFQPAAFPEPEALHVEPTPAPEVEFTCAPAVSVEVEQLNGLETHEPAQVGSVEEFVDPALVADPSDVMAFAVKVAPEVAPETQPEGVVVEEAATISQPETVEFAEPEITAQPETQPEVQPEAQPQAVETEAVVEIPVPAFAPPAAPEPAEAEVSTVIAVEAAEPTQLETAPVEEAIAAELTAPPAEVPVQPAEVPAQPTEAPAPPAEVEIEPTVESAADPAAVQQSEMATPEPPVAEVI
ncbi:MAG TPA: response regulator, partial [Clostridia bacterium]|nr:response regulator [Clostridia bacterium]